MKIKEYLKRKKVRFLAKAELNNDRQRCTGFGWEYNPRIFPLSVAYDAVKYYAQNLPIQKLCPESIVSYAQRTSKIVQGMMEYNDDPPCEYNRMQIDELTQELRKFPYQEYMHTAARVAYYLYDKYGKYDYMFLRSDFGQKDFGFPMEEGNFESIAALLLYYQRWSGQSMESCDNIIKRIPSFIKRYNLIKKLRNKKGLDKKDELRVASRLETIVLRNREFEI